MIRGIWSLFRRRQEPCHAPVEKPVAQKKSHAEIMREGYAILADIKRDMQPGRHPLRDEIDAKIISGQLGLHWMDPGVQRSLDGILSPRKSRG